MIVSFRHRGLKRLYVQGDGSKVRPDLLVRIRVILAHLDAARSVDDMRLPGLRLHALKGDLKGCWSVTVSANWRIIFRFAAEDARDVDPIDYH
ncbi:MAG: type II toxin-antitoxin system RelE/ParE family toxin [Acidobacteriota bacterium]